MATTNLHSPHRATFSLFTKISIFFLIGWLPGQSAWAQTSAQELAFGPILRINAGTQTEATADSETFIGDTYFSENSNVGPEVNNAIAETTQDAIYQSERISNSALETFGYSIPVLNGTYTINLHFAETAFTTAGQRVFDVEIEGITILDNYDILDKAGNSNTAVQETILNIPVSDGELNIDFLSIVERAKINAIEISGAVNTVGVPFALNAGGADFTGSSLSWMEDTGDYFLNEGTAFTKTANIAGTTDDDLYEAERFGNTIRFVLPGVEKGIYTIELHFAETFHQESGQRLFDAYIEGDEVLSDYDIFVEAGDFSTAVVETFPNISILDGILNITLDRSVGSATINAIAITEASSVSNETEDTELPGTHKLTAAYPNPFNPQTQFSLAVATTQNVSINVFNLLGQRVQTLHQGLLAGQQDHAFQFEADTLPSGIYLIQVTGEFFSEIQQVTLLK